MAHRSLRLAAAYLTLEMAGTEQLVDAAHAALDDGVYSHSLGEVATFKGSYSQDCRLLFTAALRELGEPIPGPAAAVAALLEHHAVRLAEGATAPAEVLRDLYAIVRDQRYGPRVEVPPDSLAALRPFTDMYYAVEESESYRAYVEAAGSPPSGGPGPDELYAEAVALAARWCRERWGPVMSPSWFTRTVVSLARGIDADRAFDRLPILADALQDAGCEDAAVLEHCRGPGPHTRGCWVVDLVLGKA